MSRSTRYLLLAAAASALSACGASSITEPAPVCDGTTKSAPACQNPDFINPHVDFINPHVDFINPHV